DCINACQRESAKESPFAACASRLTSPATRRPPPTCGTFRLQPEGSLLRQTPRWRKPDSNSWSRFEKSRPPRHAAAIPSRSAGESGTTSEEQKLGVYGGMNENFVLVAGRSRWQADGV